MRIQRSLAILIGSVTILVVAGIVLAIVAARRPETAYAPDSPEGTVATYLRLLQAGQVDAAYDLTDLEGPPYLTRERFHQQFDQWSSRAHRVTLLRPAVRSDERASVTVEIAAFSPEPFGGGDRAAEHTFTLVRRSGVWRITGPAYLYP